MDSCAHVENVRPARNHSILRPQKWLCSVCGTTESVYACLSCAHVACGRFNEEHSLLHYTKTKHPLAIEVNRKHVYCYECDDYVLNDNTHGDLDQLRSALSAIATQSFQDIPATQQPLLRSFSLHEDWSEANQDEDKLRTAETYWRTLLLRRAFRQWVGLTLDGGKQESPQRKQRRVSGHLPPLSPPSFVRRPTLTAGVTGLRNLGNTCYMNAVLQILSHIEKFRRFFHHLLPASDFSPWSSPYKRAPSSAPSPSAVGCDPASRPSPGRDLMRQNTMELFQHLSGPETTPKRAASSRVGLAGGRATVRSCQGIAPQALLQPQMDGTDDPSQVSLCVELHALFRVLWSGKWAQVSPHALLQAVWTLLPDFRGYKQQDAQEFLCELLDRVQQELTAEENPAPLPDIVSSVFEGKLTSQVTCERCGHKSRTEEPFLDLSLEFPDRYQVHGSNWSGPQGPCHLTEMLKKFTAVEELERESYECEHCNGKRRRASKVPPVMTDANKQLFVSELPDVLRLHLKRFRWSGRNHREKILTHVIFEDRLSMADYSTEADSTEYTLTGVVVHHGTGFVCGHYTAFTWNSLAGSWVCCNDSRMELCSLETVSASEAYILFYSRVKAGEDSTDLATPLNSHMYDSDGEVTFRSQPSETDFPDQKVLHR